MQRICVIFVVAVGCGGHTPEPQKSATVAAHPVAVKPGSNAGTGSGSPAAALPDIGCLTPTCAFHPGTATYFTCLSGGAGACFHFGGPCAPADGCMYDPAEHAYKQCAKPSEGTCLQWGGACAPKSACMFDPVDNLHHHCDELAGGACKKYGALCAP